LLAEAEHAVGECVGSARDDDQLEGRPAQVLGDVERGGRVRAAPPERVAQEHHSGHPPVGADQAGEAEKRRPERRADHRGEKRLA
jgi:hypothetical protein